MVFKIDNYTLPVVIERKKIKNTYLRVLEDYTLYVTTNSFITNKQIEKHIIESEDAIKKMLVRVIRQNEKSSKFFYLGEEYHIIIVNNFFEINKISHRIYTPSIDFLEKQLKKEMVRLFNERLKICYSYMKKIPYPKLKIRKMKTRWGVCNKRDASITLNSELLKKTIEEIDYVIFHELCHFRYFDHSALFWNEVGKYCPRYKEIRKKLRDV